MRSGGIVAQRGIAALILGLFLQVQPVTAQNVPIVRSPVLSLDQERLFAGSDFGQRLEAELQADGLILEAENRQIEATLEAEEKDLTARRAELDPEAFRVLANEFDEKVQRIRSEQAAKARALGERSETAQRTFLDTARPVLEQFMLDAGAVVIIDPRSVVMSRAAIDVTDEVMIRVNNLIGDGSDDKGNDNDPAPLEPGSETQPETDPATQE